jgi:hypothetical protein
MAPITTAAIEMMILLVRTFAYLQTSSSRNHRDKSSTPATRSLAQHYKRAGAIIFRRGSQCVGIKNLKVAKWLHYISTAATKRGTTPAPTFRPGRRDRSMPRNRGHTVPLRRGVRPLRVLVAEIHAPSSTAMRPTICSSLCGAGALCPGGDTARQDTQQPVLVAAPTAVHRLVH